MDFNFSHSFLTVEFRTKKKTKKKRLQYFFVQQIRARIVLNWIDYKNGNRCSALNLKSSKYFIFEFSKALLSIIANAIVFFFRWLEKWVKVRFSENNKGKSFCFEALFAGVLSARACPRDVFLRLESRRSDRLSIERASVSPRPCWRADHSRRSVRLFHSVRLFYIVIIFLQSVFHFNSKPTCSQSNFNGYIYFFINRKFNYRDKSFFFPFERV